MKRCFVLTIKNVGIHFAAKQKFNEARRALRTCNMNGSVAVLVRNAVVNSRVKKNVSTVDVSTRTSPVQSAVTVFGDHVDVGVPANEKLYNGYMSICGGKMQRCSTIAIGNVYTRTGLKQKLYGSEVAAAGCPVHGSVAKVVGRVGIGTVAEKSASHLNVAPNTCPVKGRVVLSINFIDIHGAEHAGTIEYRAVTVESGF